MQPAAAGSLDHDQAKINIASAAWLGKGLQDGAAVPGEQMEEPGYRESS